MTEASENNVIEKCHAYLDGILPPEEETEFLTALADPANKQTFDALKQICQTLETLPHPEVPPGLEDKILLALAKETQEENVVSLKNGKSRLVKIAAAVLLMLGMAAAFHLEFSRLTPQIAQELQNSNRTSDPNIAIELAAQAPPETEHILAHRSMRILSADERLEQDLETFWFEMEDLNHQMVALEEETDWTSAGL